MTERPLKFPAIAFIPGASSDEPESLVCIEGWTEVSEGTREEASSRLTWEFIDSAGARWRMVDSPAVHGRKGLLFRSETYFAFAPRFERQPRLRLQAFKDRACAAILANPDYFSDDEVVAGELNEPIEPEVLLEARCNIVCSARTNAEIIEAIGVPADDLGVVKPYADQVERDRRSLRNLIFTAVALLGCGIGSYVFIPQIRNWTLHAVYWVMVWPVLMVVGIVLILAWGKFGEFMAKLTNLKVFGSLDNK